MLAFRHPRPAAVLHVVVIPKRHVVSLLDTSVLDGDLLLSMVLAVQTVATRLGLTEGEGFYVRTNMAAPGVTPHMHWHILGPGAGAHWPRAELARETGGE